MKSGAGVHPRRFFFSPRSGRAAKNQLKFLPGCGIHASHRQQTVPRRRDG